MKEISSNRVYKYLLSNYSHALHTSEHSNEVSNFFQKSAKGN